MRQVMENKVKSGKEILDDFFSSISEIENVDKDLAEILSRLYEQEKLTDTNLRNEILNLRTKNVSKD